LKNDNVSLLSEAHGILTEPKKETERKRENPLLWEFYYLSDYTWRIAAFNELKNDFFS